LGSQRSGGSKQSFITWLASSNYTHAWHLEGDVFYSGRWERLVSDDRWQHVDVAARFELHDGGVLDSTPTWRYGCLPWCPAHTCQLSAGVSYSTVTPTAVQTYWPILRFSRRIARELTSAMARGARGHYEVLMYPLCEQHAWCHMAPLDPSDLGMFRLAWKGHDASVQLPAVATTNRTERCRLFHPSKCQHDPTLGTLALEWSEAQCEI